MVEFQLQVTNSPRVGTCGTCYVTIACNFILCNNVNTFTIFFIVLYTSWVQALISETSMVLVSMGTDQWNQHALINLVSMGTNQWNQHGFGEYGHRSVELARLWWCGHRSVVRWDQQYPVPWTHSLSFLSPLEHLCILYFRLWAHVR